MRTLTRALIALAAVVAASLPVLPAVAATAAPPAAAAGPVAGDVDDFTFRSMHADYTIGRDADGASTLKVVETFIAVFPETDQNRGMKRVIPDSYNGQPLDPTVLSVTDDQGRPRPFETDSDDDGLTVTSRADGYVHGPQTYVFTYTLRHVTWTFADSGADEFYWDVNGVDWAQPFAVVSATLHVPGELERALTGEQACYQGGQGATDRCEISATTDASGAAVVTARASDLAPRQTMTIAVGFSKGTFVPFDSAYLASPWGWVQGIAGLGAIGAVIFAIVNRMRRLTDDPGRPTIIAEYEPPRGVDALQAAVLLGKTPKAIPAEVLEQALAGSIRILQGGKRMFGGYTLQAELVDPSRADEDGRMLLRGLFGEHAAAGALFTFGRSNTRFAAQARRMLKFGERSLTRLGLRRAVRRRDRAVPIAIAAVVSAVAVVAGIAALAAYVQPVLPIVLMMLGIAAFVVCVIMTVRRPLTARGAEVRDHLKGLQVFIEWAEADRIRMLQSPSGAERVPVDVDDPRQMLKIYERLLPYAVVFGQERQWADRLAALYPEGSSPSWYAGQAAFNAAAFSAGVGSLSAAASSASSTSGGSSGGGSAGGGGGGGGGGGV